MAAQIEDVGEISGRYRADLAEMRAQLEAMRGENERIQRQKEKAAEEVRLLQARRAALEQR